MNLPKLRGIENGFCSTKNNYIKISYKIANNRGKINRRNFFNYKPSLSKVQSTNDISKMTFSPNQKSNFILYNKIKNSTSQNNIIFPSTTINNSKGLKNDKRKFISTLTLTKNNKYNNSFDNNLSSSKIDKLLNKTQTFMQNSFNLQKSLSEQKLDIKNKKINLSKKGQIKESLNINKVLTKFKINKIISDKSKNLCLNFEKQNSLFNEKFKNTIISEKFINYQIKKHRNFIFDKDDKSINKLKKYMINSGNSSHNTKDLIMKEVIKSLNKKDIKIILSDLFYFKNVNKNIVNSIKNIKSNSLKDLLNLEEGKEKEDEEMTESEKETENKNIKNNNNKENEIDKLKKLDNENMLLEFDKYVKKLINKDLDKRLKQINKKDKKKDDKQDNINSCDAKVRMVNGIKSFEKDEKIEDACFRSFFYNINKEMTKEHFIENNNRRLCKEDFFQYRKTKKLKEEKQYNDLVLKYLDTLKKIHFKINKY